MRVHPRTQPVQMAEIELNRMVWEWMERHDLTYVEAIRGLTHQIDELTKYMLRQERHPDQPDRKADEA